MQANRMSQAKKSTCFNLQFHPQVLTSDGKLKFPLVFSDLAIFAIVKVNTVSTMKKINWWRVAFFLLMVGMVVLESCRLFKPKCNCPHF